MQQARRRSDGEALWQRSTLPVGFSLPVQLPDDTHCAFCVQLLDDAVTVHPCFHTCCRACLGAHSSCPCCHGHVEKVGEPSLATLTALRELHVTCDFCAWKGPRLEATRHRCRERAVAEAAAAVEAAPRNPRNWVALGTAMEKGRNVVVQDTVTTKLDCYGRAIELEPEYAMAWGNLGAAMDRTVDDFIVQGSRVTKLDCAVRALDLDPSLGSVWHNLGNSLGRGEELQVAGEVVFKDTCYLRAVERQPKLSAAWYNLGLCLDRDMVIDYNGHEFDNVMCFVMAVGTNPQLADGWLQLGLAGIRSKTFLGRRWSANDCFAEALRLTKGAMPRAWLGLAKRMRIHDTVEVMGRRYTRPEIVAKVPGVRPPSPGTLSDAGTVSSASSFGSTLRKANVGCPCGPGCGSVPSTASPRERVAVRHMDPMQAQLEPSEFKAVESKDAEADVPTTGRKKEEIQQGCVIM